MDFQSRSKSSDAGYGCANIQRANSPTLVNFDQSRQGDTDDNVVYTLLCVCERENCSRNTFRFSKRLR